jgi:hypothetical protein
MPKQKTSNGDTYEPWVSGAVVQRLFGISSSKLNRITRGNPPLQHIRIGRSYRYRVSDVERYFRKYGAGISDIELKWEKKDDEP